MQLRGHTYNDPIPSLEVTERDQLEGEINCLHELIARQLVRNGISSIEITSTNVMDVTDLFPPQGAFLLGRLCTLVQLHSELYGEDRVIPWIKKPENN